MAIPISRRRIALALEADTAPEQRERFRRFTEMLGAIYHFEFHAKLEALKAAYAPLAGEVVEDLDGAGGTEAGVISQRPLSESERSAAAQSLGDVLAEVLSKGNYQALGREAIERAFHERAVLPIDVAIDLDQFEELVLYVRGESRRAEVVPRWFGLRKKTIELASYDRVCLYLRFKQDPGADGGRTVLKLFRNIPRADLEMLFPNMRLKMRTVDKLLIGIPALVGGFPVLAKLAPAALALSVVLGLAEGEVGEASIIAGLSGLVGLGLFLFRQWSTCPLSVGARRYAPARPPSPPNAGSPATRARVRGGDGEAEQEAESQLQLREAAIGVREVVPA